MEKDNCINCNSEVSGAYCASCGQRSAIHRITFKTLLQEYLGRLFGLDTKFLRTAKDLTINPGIVGRTFVEGNRVKYMGPVAYFFILSTLFLLSFSLLDVDITDFMFSAGVQYGSSLGGETPNEQQLELQTKVMTLLSDNIRALNFLIIPFFGFAGRIFYRKTDYNVLEHMINGFYIFGQTTILTIIGVFLYKITGYVITPVLAVLIIPYFMWATVRFYQKKGFKSWIKSFFLYVVAYIMFLTAFLALFIGSLTAYKKFINPDFLS